MLLFFHLGNIYSEWKKGRWSKGLVVKATANRRLDCTPPVSLDKPAEPARCSAGFCFYGLVSVREYQSTWA